MKGDKKQIYCDYKLYIRDKGIKQGYWVYNIVQDINSLCLVWTRSWIWCSANTNTHTHNDTYTHIGTHRHKHRPRNSQTINKK